MNCDDGSGGGETEFGKESGLGPPESQKVERPGKIRHRAATALLALGDKAGLDIFQLLSEHSPKGLSAGKISRELKMPPGAASKQIMKLHHARLIRDTGAGNRKAYYADKGLARDCLTFVHQLAEVLRPA